MIDSLSVLSVCVCVIFSYLSLFFFQLRLVSVSVLRALLVLYRNALVIWRKKGQANNKMFLLKVSILLLWLVLALCSCQNETEAEAVQEFCKEMNTEHVNVDIYFCVFHTLDYSWITVDVRFSGSAIELTKYGGGGGHLRLNKDEAVDFALKNHISQFEISILTGCARRIQLSHPHP